MYVFSQPSTECPPTSRDESVHVDDRVHHLFGMFLKAKMPQYLSLCKSKSESVMMMMMMMLLLLLMTMMISLLMMIVIMLMLVLCWCCWFHVFKVMMVGSINHSFPKVHVIQQSPSIHPTKIETTNFLPRDIIILRVSHNFQRKEKTQRFFGTSGLRQRSRKCQEFKAPKGCCTCWECILGRFFRV